MNTPLWDETFTDQEVTYIVQLADQVIIIEHVPARVNTETGERLFAPATVERIHAIVGQQYTPNKVITAPVYEFAA